VLDGPNAGAVAPAGAQSFPGFQPSDATNQIRNNLAGYLDVESHTTGIFTIGAAGRAERYSDFGSTITGKTNARLEFFPGYAVRGAIGTGFRAPSLAQEFFSSTATNFIGGVPFDIKTFPAESPGGKALGAVPLKPEKSLNISAGLTAEPLRSLSLSVDYYKININDRIVFSENFTTAAIRNLLAQQGFPTLGGGRFFTNAIDTRTRGLDVVGRYGVNFASDATFRLTAGANWTKTEAKRTSATPPQLTGLDETLFGQVEKTRIERGQPRRTIHINGDLTAGKWNLTAHEAYFGEHTGATTFGANAAYIEQHFSGAWITDASIGYTFARGMTFAVGGNNLFDKYPDAIGPAFNNNGVLHYPNTSPWGFNGGSYYVKLSWHR
jgi:iron complex outermembrane receptor protein